MLDHLTNYLLRYRKLSIPSFGTIELVQQPATLDIVNKLIYPPYYKAVFSDRQEVADHQLRYLQAALGMDTPVQPMLNELGEQLKQQVRQQAFVWKGIGTFEFGSENILFWPKEIVNPLQPVPANKVLREHVQHSVLVGDQVVLSDGSSEHYTAIRSRTDLTTIIGWIMVVAAAAFILYFLYEHEFGIESTGLQQRIEQKAPQPTYK